MKVKPTQHFENWP